MIGKIKGSIVEVDGNLGLIETSSGVFYTVYLPSSLLSHVLPVPVEIYTYLQVRDDALVLFGFQSKPEYRMFTLLLTVPGVGPKTAFGIIAYSNVELLVEAIKKNDTAYFSKIPGLGKKTAMKILLELSSKMESEFQLENIQVSEDEQTVIDALVSLGYRVQDAKNIIATIPRHLSVEEKITTALQSSSKAKRQDS